MNTETNNETHAEIAHPNARGTGCAIRFTLHPAHGNVPGCVMCEIAKQKSAVSVTGTGETPTFDWDGVIAIKMCVSDLAQMLMVLRGYQESIADGKGLFHRTATANSIIRFARMIEPCPGYRLEVSRKPFDGEPSSASIVFRPDEAYWLSMALEGAMPTLVFGVPAIRA